MPEHDSQGQHPRVQNVKDDSGLPNHQGYFIKCLPQTLLQKVYSLRHRFLYLHESLSCMIIREESFCFYWKGNLSSWMKLSTWCQRLNPKQIRKWLSYGRMAMVLSEIQLWMNFATRKGIQHQFSTPVHGQLGVAERAIGTLSRMMRAIMLHANAPLCLWENRFIRRLKSTKECHTKLFRTFLAH